ncbi:MAG: hypothetical protein R2793_00355 [Flavobacteriaceae bacterium]
MKTLLASPERTHTFPVVFHMTINGKPIDFERNIKLNKYNDDVKGEVHQPFGCPTRCDH